MSLRRTSRTRKAKKAAAKARKKAAKSAPPRRSMILVLAALGGLVAAVVAKRALSGGDEAPAPSPPDVDRADATWTPQGVQPPIPPAPAEAPASNGSD